MATTQTMTISRTATSPAESSTPETFELSLKSPGKSLREISRRVVNGAPSRPQESSSDEEDHVHVHDDVEPPTTAQAVAQRWNKPRANISKLGFAFWTFVIAGMNDGAVGVRSPCISRRSSPSSEPNANNILNRL